LGVNKGPGGFFQPHNPLHFEKIQLLKDHYRCVDEC
jgi:hypothetical protein